MIESPLTFNPNKAAFAAGAVNGLDSVQWLRTPDAQATFPSSVSPRTALELLDASGQFILARAGLVAGWLPRERVSVTGPTPAVAKPVMVRSYRAKSQSAAGLAFEAESARLAEEGYQPVSQSWAPGSYGAGAFIVALILAFLVVGLFLIVGLLIVKPAGVLSVTYQYRTPALTPAQEELLGRPSQRQMKRCPRCAEDVQAEAIACRYCSHEFLKATA